MQKLDMKRMPMVFTAVILNQLPVDPINQLPDDPVSPEKNLISYICWKFDIVPRFFIFKTILQLNVTL